MSSRVVIRGVHVWDGEASSRSRAGARIGYCVANSPDNRAEPEQWSVKSNLLKPGFLSLVFTQFFGAANDNILKMVLTYMVIDGAWAGRLGAGGQGIVGMCFTIPFILLSGYAGQFADRNSKRYVSVLVKVIEIPIALLALVGFFTGNLWITLGALIALTCQSSFFGPAKYGMIPEIVPDRDLSRQTQSQHEDRREEGCAFHAGGHRNGRDSGGDGQHVPVFEAHGQAGLQGSSAPQDPRAGSGFRGPRMACEAEDAAAATTCSTTAG